MPRLSLIVAVLLIVLGGVLHGVWSHRWNQLSTAEMENAVVKVEGLPLVIDDWSGERLEQDQQLQITQQELFGIGRSACICYTNRSSGARVTMSFSFGPTAAMVGHVPTICYPSHGFTSLPPNIRVSPNSPASADDPRFWVGTFTKPLVTPPNYIRVYWSWSDGSGWKTPDNPLKEFRRSPGICKVYFIRNLSTADEPIEGDPAFQLMNMILPKIDNYIKNQQ